MSEQLREADASPEEPSDSDQHRDVVQHRTLRVVVVGQVLAGAGLAAGVTVGALLAEEILGTESLAGLPAALFTLGSALAAYLVGRVSQRSGRRVGLGAGFAFGALGAVGVVVAAAIDSVPLLFVALFVYGAGSVTNLQARYAGTDLAGADRRGAAVSIALVSTTAGAVAGPNLTGPLGYLATGLGLPALSGPFLLAAVAYGAAGLALVTLLRPDPLLLARRLHLEAAADAAAASPVPGSTRPRATAWVGATIMILTQMTMVAIMTMTPVHMREHHHGLTDVGLVISLHIAAMYLPSPLTGLLVDRVGRAATAAASGAVLVLAGLTAALARGDSMGFTVTALVLLGLGWNLGLISGTALVVDGTDLANRSRTQGTIDVGVALAGAGAGVLSGLVVAAWSYPALALGSAALTVTVLPTALALRRRTPSTPGA